nr:aspartate aminotransferase [Tanacetum cinerariifolium]
MYDGLKHSFIEGDHIVKSLWDDEFASWICEVDGFAHQLLEIQDNIPICASIISQRLALHSMEVGSQWVTDQVKNHQLSVDVLSPLGDGAVKGGEGAIYLWAKLPEKFINDFEVVHWLANKHYVVQSQERRVGVRVTLGSHLVVWLKKIVSS